MNTDSYRYSSAARANLPTEQTEAAMSDHDKAPRPFIPSRREIDDEPVLAWARDNGTPPPPRNLMMKPRRQTLKLAVLT